MKKSRAYGRSLAHAKALREHAEVLQLDRATGRTLLAHVDPDGGVQLYRESVVKPSGWGWTEPGVDSESDTRGACTPSDLGPPEEAALAVMSIVGIHREHADVHRRLAKVVLATTEKPTQKREDALVGNLGPYLRQLHIQLRNAVEQHKERAVAVAVENSDPAHPWPQHRARGQAMYQAVIDAYERGEWSPWDELAAALIESTGTKGKALAARVRELAEEDRQYYAQHGTFQDERGPWATWLSFKPDHPTMCPMAWHLANAVFEDVSLNMERIAISAKSDFQGTPMLRMPVDKVSTRIQLAVSGGDPSHRKGNATVEEKLDDITGCTIVWHDGEEEPLQLTLPWSYTGMAPLVAVQRKYGQGALRQLQTALFLDWVSWRDQKQSYATWWPEKHLAVQGSSAPTRREMLEYMDLLEAATLAVTYAAGRVESAPLVALRNKTRTVAVKGVRQGRLLHAELQVHKALTRGLRRSYWPYPLRMLQVSTRGGGDVYPLAVMAGQMFRTKVFAGKEPNAQPVAKKKGRALLESIGGRWQKGRDLDPRAAKRILRGMEACVHADILGEYSHDGDPAHCDTTWTLTPSVTSMQHAMAGDGLKKLPLLPETGDELAMWLKNTGETQVDMAKLLGVSESYLKKSKRLGELPIGGKLSVQIMRFAWKLDTPKPDQGT